MSGALFRHLILKVRCARCGEWLAEGTVGSLIFSLDECMG